MPLTSYRGLNHVFHHRQPLSGAARFCSPPAFLALSSSLASAQTPPTALPPVEVSSPTDPNKTRARPLDNDGSGTTTRPARTAQPSRGAGTGTSDGASPGTADAGGTGTGVRQFNGIVGASSTVITAQEIAHSPSHNLPEISRRCLACSCTSLYGGVNGAKTSVDLRGFGAFATSNTLILVNGRRLNDVDMAQVDLSTIPLQSIERIEITRGNSGAVLYGDNAIGGVINIVLKSGVGGPPVTMRAEAGVGSFNQRLANISAATNYGPWSTSFYGNAIKSDGYRDNNALDQKQRRRQPQLHDARPQGVPDRDRRRPEARLPRRPHRRSLASGVNELVTNRRAPPRRSTTATSRAPARRPASPRRSSNGVDLIVDGGVRKKDTQSGFFGTVPFARRFRASPRPMIDAHLQTWSITPRLSVKNVDVRDAVADPDRHRLLRCDLQLRTGRVQGRSQPIHIYDLSQQIAGRLLAAYRRPVADDRFLLWRQGSEHQPERAGSLQSQRARLRRVLRLQRPGAPAGQQRNQYALHVGLEHRFNDVFSVFGRAARAFRTPNVDERVSSGPFGLRRPSSTRSPGLQAEDPDLARHRGRLPHQEPAASRCNPASTAWTSRTRSISIPALFYNVNLDPTRRYGSETSASLRVSDTVLLRGGMAYTRAVFREGQFAGNDVPLVSRYTASGGVTWNIWQNYLVFDATLRAWSERFMDNDQANTQRRIPANATVDLKLSGAYDHFFWSVEREQSVRRAVLRLRDREHVHARPLLGLSAARPDLHGEGRRDVLIQAAGSASRRTGDAVTHCVAQMSRGTDGADAWLASFDCGP